MKLNKAIQEKSNIIVEFYTDWSASSFIIAEMLKQLRSDYAGRLEVLFINADESAELCADYNIHKIPTFLFFQHGNIVKTLEGTASRTEIIELIENLVLNASGNDADVT